ncbi:hypothetical protein [Catenulispora rubra]|uniref:hypothetical protein n=1 Tax=Catenulispora rubra TaxID=280293 RepID=UPI001E367CDD|nr:hypothetical protein [Catenulispora rubra]
MSHTTEAFAFVPEQKGPAGPAQNLPTDLTAAYGRAITATTPRQAAAAGLVIHAEAHWPESVHDHTPPSLPGFIVSSFSPIAAETAARCLKRRPATESITEGTTNGTTESTTEAVTAVLITTARGDRESAAHVARTVADAGLLGPLLFFQSVPNAVAGHIATRWHLTGPVVCLADPASALETAALLIEDGDADEVLLVRIEQGDHEQGDHDQAHAVLLRPASPAPAAPGERP